MPQLPVLNNRPPPTADPERDRIAAALADVLSTGSGPDGAGGQVRFGRHDRLLYSTDASLYQVEPIGVVVPASIDDAARVVRWCSENGVPMLPRGGGTSLAGQCTNHAVVIDLTPHCRAIGHFDAAGLTIEVEPGISIDEVNDYLARRNAGLFFAPDPATTRQCAIGGAIGNNAAGARSILYGRTSENVDRIEVVLATGERLWLGPNAGATDPTARRLGEAVLGIARANARLIRERFPRTIRRNAGYALDSILDQAEAGATPESVNLVPLLCGSEGTLAVSLRAVLKLHPSPKAKGLALIGFDSVDQAIECVRPILATKPSAVELLDDVVLDAARGNEECRKYLAIMPRPGGKDAGAILYVEYFAFDAGAPRDEIAARFAALRAAVPVHEASILEYADGPSMAKAWALRKAGEPLLHGLPGPRKPITFVEDNAVPVERLGEFVREFRAIVTRHGTRAAYWAHASVGVLHVRPMIDIHDPADRERLRAIAVEIADLARRCGGIMSGEHGDGRVRGPLLERFFGPELMGAFREVKRAFDPHNLLNPDMEINPGPVESITTNLRVDAESEPSGASRRLSAQNSAGRGLAPLGSDINTYFDYSGQEGFGHAVEQCNGAGVCRKKAGAGGTMCPSYHATLDERHSTRGRGNALRLAISGQFSGLSGHGTPKWDDEETIRTLDLCLSCKACKSECPSNVDIARLKAEYTAQRFKQRSRVPLSEFLMGHVRVLNALGAAAPGLANRFGNSVLGRTVINRVMEMHPQRTLPRFSRSLYSHFTPVAPRPLAPSVLLFTDCFTTYNESHIGVAAVRVLRALGYTVSLSGSHCCGRSMISVGMLEQAVETIDRAMTALRPAIEDDTVKAIIICEPSCLSAIKDDWLGLKCETPLALRRKLAGKAMLPEDFVDRFWEQHPISRARLLTPPPAQGISPVLLHAHCHQKALDGADTSARLLRRLVGDRLKVLETGCCGMAGSFGFARHRYDLSMRIANLALLPALRAAPPEAVIVAPGTSCRHQIHDAARAGAIGARGVLHPIELAAQLLA